MTTKTIGSTQAQNNFGQVLDDVNHNHTRYIIERRGIPQAIIINLDDLASLLADQNERQQMSRIVSEVRPQYRLGRVLKSAKDSH